MLFIHTFNSTNWSYFAGCVGEHQVMWPCPSVPQGVTFWEVGAELYCEERGFFLLRSSISQVNHDGIPLNTQFISFVAYYERLWMVEISNKMRVWDTAHRTNNSTEDFMLLSTESSGLNLYFGPLWRKWMRRSVAH